jgi:hypothetical protein|tara:strand:+ start:104 stop:451 length:348 start_codon:yes stop_codon:yes gene_type:complete
MFKQKIIYWDYAFWIFVYAVIFLSIGVTIGKTLERVMPNHDGKKHRFIVLLEIYLQIGLIAILTYIMREYVEAVLNKFFIIEKKPGKFAALVIAPTLFSQMPDLVKKINHIWGLV